MSYDPQQQWSQQALPPQWQQPPQTYYPVQAPMYMPMVIEPKDKTTAVVLAVFLGVWTWLYTYKTDSGLFWANLVAGILTAGLWAPIAWVWAIICTASRPQSWYASFPYGNARVTPVQQYQPPQLPC